MKWAAIISVVCAVVLAVTLKPKETYFMASSSNIPTYSNPQDFSRRQCGDLFLTHDEVEKVVAFYASKGIRLSDEDGDNFWHYSDPRGWSWFSLRAEPSDYGLIEVSIWIGPCICEGS